MYPPGSSPSFPGQFPSEFHNSPSRPGPIISRLSGSFFKNLTLTL
jgi:hypothetical protein